MRIAKVYSKVLSKALELESFCCLSLYTRDFRRTEDGCFLSEVVDFDGRPTLGLKLTLEDYFFNECKEGNRLFAFAEEVIGKKEIDLRCLKVVEL